MLSRSIHYSAQVFTSLPESILLQTWYDHVSYQSPGKANGEYRKSPSFSATTTFHNVLRLKPRFLTARNRVFFLVGKFPDVHAESL